MFCYNCGCRLSEQDFCTSCQADVKVYKKIIYASNKYYNEGLQRAQVRDMSGAIASLHQSLKFYKGNIEARNLLGLVYFEIGEVVPALCEWVISKNQRPEKNIANDYITMVQSNTSRLDTLNQTVKKYNQALKYCQQDSKDLAVIQLKKVLSLNSKYLKAHLLLALLFIDNEQWERAKRELTKALNIDRNNVQALTYMKEVEMMLAPDESGKSAKNKEEESVRYQADNEIIIQPSGFMEKKHSGIGSLLNLAIGFIIGVAAIYGLVVPSVRTNANNDAQKKITEISNQIDSKNSTISDLENSLTTAKEESEMLRKEVEAYKGTDATLQRMDELIRVGTLYLVMEEDGSVTAQEVADELEKVGSEIVLTDTSESFQNLYNLLYARLGPQIAEESYRKGDDLYQNGHYEEAVAELNKAVFYKEDYYDAYYIMGHCYRKSGDNESAVNAYQKVVDLAPESDRAVKALGYIEELMPQ